MSFKSNLIKAGAIGAVITALSAGAAFAAVATSSANVRSGPGTGYHTVNRLYPGEPVAIVDRTRGWCEVAVPGPNGWVRCTLLAQTAFDDGLRFRRFDRFDDRFDRGPGVSFSFGFGTPRVHMHSGMPWWW